VIGFNSIPKPPIICMPLIGMVPIGMVTIGIY
jgi:hypothetical protein